MLSSLSRRDRFVEGRVWWQGCRGDTLNEEEVLSVEAMVVSSGCLFGGAEETSARRKHQPLNVQEKAKAKVTSSCGFVPWSR